MYEDNAMPVVDTVDRPATSTFQKGQSIAEPAQVKKRGRGRPKGSTSATLSEVRAQAAEEKRELRERMNEKILTLQEKLRLQQIEHKNEVRALRSELEILQRKETALRQILSEKVYSVADHLHQTLTSWAEAEMEEASIEKRRRGRPRKTLKT